MSSGKNPLMLMMALAMPGAAHSLGLGDIHVDSALDERLVAEIDIVGATPAELADLRAAVANRETFLRFGAERPAFLSSATFKLGQNSRGRPVLAVRSADPFTEPLVNFLVDLRWHNGQLVREYTLLLDPPGFGAADRAPAAPQAAPAVSAPSAPPLPQTPVAPVAAAAPAATPNLETKTQTVARQVDPPAARANPKSGDRAERRTTHVKVGAKATLRGIAWRVGERSESNLQRMMIAIFRANPGAFDGNINRLYRGAVLTIPSVADLASISAAEATHEFHAQMAAWRDSARTVAANRTTARSTIPAPPATSAASDTASASAPSLEPLNLRIQSLEKELSEMKGLLESEQDQLQAMQRPIRAASPRVAASPTLAAPARVNITNPAGAPPKQEYGAALIAGLGALAAALAALYFRIRRRKAAAARPVSDGHMDAAAARTAVAAAAQAPAAAALAPADHEVLDAPQDHTRAPDHASGGGSEHPAETAVTAPPAAIDATHPMLPKLPDTAGRSEMAAGAGAQTAPQDTTVNLQVDTVNLRMSSAPLDYNLLDLDLTAQHVQMPSVLNQGAVVKERRTNLADVLRLAIEREPNRHDLRMKLLELYYSAAATNRKAFLEAVQKFARDRDLLETDQWDKIASMGRQIASDNPLFAEETATDDDLANCA